MLLVAYALLDHNILTLKTIYNMNLTFIITFYLAFINRNHHFERNNDKKV